MMKFGGILGFDNGVMLAPMGADISSPELCAAVANAGGIGLLASPSNNYDMTVKVIQDTKKRTTKPFGAGILLEFENENTVKAIFDEKLALMQVYWGQFPKEMVDEAHKHGVKVVHQVGTLKQAERAIAAGVDCIVAQGVEAGGHVAGTISLTALLPRVVDAVGDRNVTVVAAGSISDARGYVAALALGAKGIACGTRFIATTEAYAHDYYKQQVLHYNENQTERNNLYSRVSWRAYTRLLNTPFNQYWRSQPDYEQLQNDSSQPIIGHMTIFEQDVELRRFAGQAPNRTTVGELDQMVFYAGQGVGLVNDIVSVAEVIKRFVDGAKTIIQGLGEAYLPVTKDPDSKSEYPATKSEYPAAKSVCEEKEVENAPEMHGEETEAEEGRWKWVKKLCF